MRHVLGAELSKIVEMMLRRKLKQHIGDTKIGKAGQVLGASTMLVTPIVTRVRHDRKPSPKWVQSTRGNELEQTVENQKKFLEARRFYNCPT